MEMLPLASKLESVEHLFLLRLKVSIFLGIGNLQMEKLW